jgi:hypothetical protein
VGEKNPYWERPRREYWQEEPWHLGVISRTEPDDDVLQAAWQERVESPKRPRQSTGFNSSELIRSSKEIIYCLDDDGKPAFAHYHCVPVSLHEAALAARPATGLASSARRADPALSRRLWRG